MKQSIGLLLTLLLAACVPAQVPSPTSIPATATVAAPTDTATPAPTLTPAPPSTPAADLLTQSGLADLPIYWQDANGQWFAGTTAQDARLVLTTDGTWLALPDGFSQFFADGGHFDSDQNAWVDADNKLVYDVDGNGVLTLHNESIHFSPEAWSALAPDQKAEAYTKSPETSPEGWVRSNAIDTIPGMDHYQLYRDANGNAVAAYDFLTGKIIEFESASGLWVKTLPLKNGGTYDFPAIYPDRTAPDQEAEARRAIQMGIDYLVNQPGARINYLITTNDRPQKENIPLANSYTFVGPYVIGDANTSSKNFVQLFCVTVEDTGELEIAIPSTSRVNGRFDYSRVQIVSSSQYGYLIEPSLTFHLDD